MHVCHKLYPRVVYDRILEHSDSVFKKLPDEMKYKVYQYIFDDEFCDSNHKIRFYYDIINRANTIQTTISQTVYLNHDYFVFRLMNFMLIKFCAYREKILVPTSSHDVWYFTNSKNVINDLQEVSCAKYLCENNKVLYFCTLMKIHDFMPRLNYIVNWYNKNHEVNYEICWLFNNFM